mmetsp:Transcript_38501/g.95480  ORF Transcript_38501/g.95480 Transcript_38501/m.95480 type:complete len:430 (+) Transcript_38501:199-1488(+)
MSLQHNGPGMRNFTVLDAIELVRHAQLERTRLERLLRHIERLFPVDNGSDRLENSGSSSPEDFQNISALKRRSHIPERQHSLRHFTLSPLTRQVNHRLPGNSREDRPVLQRGRDKLFDAILISPQEKYVHGASLRHELFRVVHVQTLAAPTARGFLLRDDGGSVVSAELDVARPARPRTDVLAVHSQLDGHKAGLKVRPHGGHEHQDHGLAALGQPEPRGGGEDDGPQVHGVSPLFWNPLLVHAQELFDALDELVAVEGGQAQPRGGGVEASHVHFGAEQARLPILVNVCLHALVCLDRVMEHVREWVKADGPRGDDVWSSPPLSCRPLNLKHVISNHLAEAELLVGAFWERPGGLLHFQFRKLYVREGSGHFYYTFCQLALTPLTLIDLPFLAADGYSAALTPPVRLSLRGTHCTRSAWTYPTTRVVK